MPLSQYDRVRYRRQIMIPGFGEKAQLRLKTATALVAGLGGLGSPLALYLAAAGVGRLRLVDKDEVELSNLNRQVLHWDEDVGKAKVISASEKIRRANPKTHVEEINLAIDDNNAFELSKNCEVILDATDNFKVRYALNAAAVVHRTPLIHGAVHGYEGRLANVIPGKTACLKCIYPQVPQHEASLVLGTTPGVIALLQATEAIKLLTGAGVVLKDEMILYDGETMHFDKVKVSRNRSCESCANLWPE